MRVLAFGIFVLAGCSADAETGSNEENADASLKEASSIVDAASGADQADFDAGPCPRTMSLVKVDSGVFCIDRYEGAIAFEGGAWPHEMPIDSVDASDLFAVPAQGITPQGYISQVQATEMCNHAGKRLCSLEEWTAACRGEPAHDYLYPYGDTYQPGTCNEGKESPIVTLFGPNPTYSNAELNDPRCDEIEGGVAPGGTYAGCESTYGVFDMHGNLHEWVDDGSFLGGYFVDAKLNGLGCTYRTTAHATIYHDYSTGFRCCADVK